MVILQFNKLIRNKWLWGVFAIIVGGAFAFDFLVDDLLRDGKREAKDSGVGTLGGETVSSAEFMRSRRISAVSGRTATGVVAAPR